MWDKELRAIARRWLEDARKRAGLGKRELAKKVRVSHTTIYAILDEDTVPDDKTVEKITTALAINPPDPLELIRELGQPLPNYDRGASDALASVVKEVGKLDRVYEIERMKPGDDPGKDKNPGAVKHGLLQKG